MCRALSLAVEFSKVWMVVKEVHVWHVYVCVHDLVIVVIVVVVVVVIRISSNVGDF
jgi:hypothetical protein